MGKTDLNKHSFVRSFFKKLEQEIQGLVRSGGGIAELQLMLSQLQSSLSVLLNVDYSICGCSVYTECHEASSIYKQ